MGLNFAALQRKWSKSPLKHFTFMKKSIEFCIPKLETPQPIWPYIGRNWKTNLKQRSMSSGLADWQYFSLDLSSWQNLVVDLLSALPTSALTAKSAKIAVIAKIAKIGLIFIATGVSTVVKFQRWLKKVFFIFVLYKLRIDLYF